MIIVLLQRATGFGYKSYPPLKEMIDHKKAAEMEDKSRDLRRDVELVGKILSGQK